jgi:predicted alpha/beta hydrolase family esterase
MKNVLILHGTLGSPKGNWFQWLKKELQNKGYKVWVPKLPTPYKPRVSRNVKYILDNRKWKFNPESILVGHSSGPVTILGLLNELPDNVMVRKCVLIAPFTKSDWEPNSELFDYDFNFEKIKKKSKEFIILHSDTDPYTPLDQPRELAKKLNAKLIVKKGEGHFNLEKGPQYKKFPFLLNLID